MKPPLEILEDEIRFRSDLISSQVRWAATGLLAITWALLIGEPEALESVTQQWRWLVLTIGGLAMVCLLSDFVQSVLVYQLSVQAHKEAEEAQAEAKDECRPMAEAEAPFDDDSTRYRASELLFSLKQYVLVGAILAFLFLVGIYIFT